jgi:DME family drug/metabolite transporter
VPAILIVLLSAVLFGTTGTTQTFAPAGATSVSIGAARMVFGGALMALVGLINWRRRRRDAVDPTAPAITFPRSRFPLPTWLALALSGAGMALYQVTFFAGTRANGVAVGTIVTLGSAPLIAGLIEWLVRRQRPGRAWLIATALAVAGVVLLSGGSDAVHPSGLALSAAAGAAYAVEVVLLKVPLDRGWTSSDAVSWVMGLAAVACLPLLLASDMAWLPTARGSLVTAWLAVATIVCAYQLLAKGLASLPAATVTTLTLAEPATATLLGLVVVGERLTAAGVAGIAAIAAGLVLLARASRG